MSSSLKRESQKLNSFSFGVPTIWSVTTIEFQEFRLKFLSSHHTRLSRQVLKQRSNIENKRMEECFGNNNDEHLFDPTVLDSIKLTNWAECKLTWDPALCAQSLEQGLIVRPLKRLDYTRGFLELLAQLTVVGDVAQEKFLRAFSTMKKSEESYYVTVIEDINTNKVVGAGTLFIEQKFIRDCAKRARIEDVVVSDLYRGKQLGKLIIATLTILSKYLKCYKVSLDCRDNMIPFYGSLGYEIEEGNCTSMRIRFAEF